jgi:hypothetical protein
MMSAAATRKPAPAAMQMADSSSTPCGATKEKPARHYFFDYLHDIADPVGAARDAKRSFG